jgi:hypothetical protein
LEILKDYTTSINGKFVLEQTPFNQNIAIGIFVADIT